MTIDPPVPTWESLPGLLELIDGGAEAPADLAGVSYTMPGTRRGGGSVSQRLWDWLRGFRRDSILCERVPTWVTLAELKPVPGGTAELSYEVSRSAERNAEVAIVPAFGFGGSIRHELTRSVTVPAGPHGVAYETRVWVTVIRYGNERTGETMLRVDVSGSDRPPEYNVRDLASEGLVPPVSAEELRNSGYTVLQVERRAAGAAATTLTWMSKDLRNWSAKAGIELPGVPSKIDLGATCDRAEGFNATFTLPGNVDYALCTRAGEFPIVPLILPVTPE